LGLIFVPVMLQSNSKFKQVLAGTTLVITVLFLPVYSTLVTLTVGLMDAGVFYLSSNKMAGKVIKYTFTVLYASFISRRILANLPDKYSKNILVKTLPLPIISGVIIFTNFTALKLN
jgi:hypothetical protein